MYMSLWGVCAAQGGLTVREWRHSSSASQMELCQKTDKMLLPSSETSCRATLRWDKLHTQVCTIATAMLCMGLIRLIQGSRCDPTHELAGTASGGIRLPHPPECPEDRAQRSRDDARHPREPGPCCPAKRALLSLAGKPLQKRPGANACCTLRSIVISARLAKGSLRCCAALQGADPAAINAELLAKNEEVVPLLLAFLKDGPQAVSDFYVRYHTVQLLTALAAGGPYRLQKVNHLSCLPVALCDYNNLHSKCACRRLWVLITRPFTLALKCQGTEE